MGAKSSGRAWSAGDGRDLPAHTLEHLLVIFMTRLVPRGGSTSREVVRQFVAVERSSAEPIR
jgi:hypothetical protein